MDRSEVLARRLAAQRLTGPGEASAVDVVRRLTCVQSQEHAHALWSLGLRAPGLDAAAVRAELDAGAFLRTHVLRPTWHFVAAEDLRWVLHATSARVQQLNGTVLRRDGLDAGVLARGVDVVREALAGSTFLTRPELATALGAAGLPARGQGLAYVVMHAELEAVICSGPMRGTAHTYALLDERVPPGTDRDGDLGELAYRFFAGHGPASVDDLCRWASLTKAQGLAALSAAEGRLDRAEVEGVALWFEPGQPAVERAGEALLLPLYDEAMLTYPKLGFPVAPDHPHVPGTDLFVGSVVVDGVNLGNWRRELKGRTVEVALLLAPGAGPRERQLAEEAAERLATFLRRQLVLV